MNIKEHSVLEALQSPLFMAYKRNQPFSNNMLRPCPVLDNPGAISKMVAETGAYSTEMQHPESANELLIRPLQLQRLGKLRRMNSLTVMIISQSMLKMKICTTMKSRMKKENFLNLKRQKISKIII